MLSTTKNMKSTKTMKKIVALEGGRTEGREVEGVEGVEVVGRW